MPNPTRECKYCHEKRPDDLDACPHCGAGARSSCDSRFETHKATILTSTSNPVDGVHSQLTVAPGATSETTLTDQGLFTIELSGSKGIGRPGEGRVKHVLYERLSQDHELREIEGAKDHDGEDGLISVDGRTFVLQIVSAISANDIDIGQASRGTTKISINLDQFSGWIIKIIQKKVLKTDPPNTILAIDANLLGVLNWKSFAGTIRNAIGSRASLGFAAVWMVGPTVENCFQLSDTGNAAKR